MTTLTFAEPADRKSVEEGYLFMPVFSKDGLMACVTCDNATGQVLMLAHMNEEALRKTIETGEAHYWSRSRQELWHKGETSGAIQKVVEIRTDCDQDAIQLLVEVADVGSTCHTGRPTCFYRRLELPADGDVRLAAVDPA